MQRGCAALAAFVTLSLMGGQTSTTIASAGAVSFVDRRLDNGLRVIISEDHTAPVFSVAVVYDVGSRNEQPGQTGFAHLFEHMMFKGSRNVGPGEHFTLIFHNGGTMNATTSKDRTLYFETLPSNQLDLALFLEADRMRSLEVTADNLNNQRLAVLEERRRRIENQPYGASDDVVDSIAYDDFAYQHSILGSPTDLEAATLADVERFFRTYYAPNNAVLAIVGDVDAGRGMSTARKYFESIPRRQLPPPPRPSDREQAEERRATTRDALAPTLRIDIAYKTPAKLGTDDAELLVAATILAGGRSARLQNVLVRQMAIATTASAASAQGRGPGLFRITASAAPGASAAQLESALDGEIAALQTNEVDRWEIEKARALAEMALVSNLRSSASRATLLAECALFYDNPALVTAASARLESVSPAGVMRAARRYLIPERRTVVITTPGDPGKGGM